MRTPRDERERDLQGHARVGYLFAHTAVIVHDAATFADTRTKTSE